MTHNEELELELRQARNYGEAEIATGIRTLQRVRAFLAERHDYIPDALDEAIYDAQLASHYLYDTPQPPSELP